MISYTTNKIGTLFYLLSVAPLLDLRNNFSIWSNAVLSSLTDTSELVQYSSQGLQLTLILGKTYSKASNTPHAFTIENLNADTTYYLYYYLEDVSLVASNLSTISFYTPGEKLYDYNRAPVEVLNLNPDLIDNHAAVALMNVTNDGNNMLLEDGEVIGIAVTYSESEGERLAVSVLLIILMTILY
ncbi:unnamed protein product [Sphagnum balticum]